MRSALALGSVACDAYVGARPQRGCSAVALVEDQSVFKRLAGNAGASMAMYIELIEQEHFERELR
jgi:hypothetical protein